MMKLAFVALAFGYAHGFGGPGEEVPMECPDPDNAGEFIEGTPITFSRVDETDINSEAVEWETEDGDGSVIVRGGNKQICLKSTGLESPNGNFTGSFTTCLTIGVGQEGYLTAQADDALSFFNEGGSVTWDIRDTMDNIQETTSVAVADDFEIAGNVLEGWKVCFTLEDVPAGSIEVAFWCTNRFDDRFVDFLETLP